MLEAFLSGTHGIKRILVIIAVPAVNLLHPEPGDPLKNLTEENL